MKFYREKEEREGILEIDIMREEKKGRAKRKRVRVSVKIMDRTKVSMRVKISGRRRVSSLG